MIALDAADIQIPGNAKWNRASIIRALGEFQNPTTGGIGLTDAKGGSSDITAMALQALAVYRNHNTAAKNISDKALTYLANAMEMISDMVPVKVQPGSSGTDFYGN